MACCNWSLDTTISARENISQRFVNDFISLDLLDLNLLASLIVCIGFIVFNATFYNISVKSWLLVLLVEQTGGPGENHRPVASH